MRFWYLRRRPDTVRDEVDEELRVHLEMRTEDLRSRGLSPDGARRQAVRQFGDIEGTRQYCRRQDLEKENRVQRLLFVQDLAQDVRMSLRNLLRAPGLTLTVVVTVGLGIGATTAIFAAVNAALLQPLPYKDPGQLVRVYTDAPPYKFRFSVADYLAFEAQQTHFEQIAGYTGRAVAFSDGTVAERLTGREVTWAYFRLLGITPASGRDFTEQDGRPGNPRAVVISHGLWERRLGRRPDVVGKPIRLDGADYTVAGILPLQVGPLERRQDFFIAAQWSTPRRKGPFFITTLGRLREGASRSTAASELHAINRRLFPLWKSSYQDDRATWNLMDLKAFVAGDIHTVAGVALAAVALVWLIATANAANLLVARVTSRRRELAVRAALGASRGRVVRYLLAESALLAIGAAAVGVSLAWGGVRLLQTAGATYFPRTQEMGLNGPVLWLLAAVTIASGVLFGLVPALHGTGGPVDESLRSMGRSATGSAAVRQLRRALVATQFAIATPLLVVAGLLLVSLNELRRVDLGFDTRNVITGAIRLPAAQYPESASVVFWDQLKRRVETLPGVSAVAFADGRPPDDVGNFNNFDLEDQPTPSGQSQPVTPWVAVTPEYFRVLGLRLLEGRLLEERDSRTENLEAIVVDRAWAKRFFPNESAVGKRLRSGGCTQCPWTAVVGVVSQVKYAGLDKPDEGTVYSPLDRGAAPSRYIVARTAVDPRTVFPAVRQVIRNLDPTLPFSDTATMEEMVARSVERPRSLSMLVAGFAIIALVLSTVGIYGVMAYYVQQHTKDISIRLALGGSPRDVLRLVVGQGMQVVATGVVVGVVVAFVATRLMSTLLFGVSATDALTFAAAGTFLLAVALLACVVPAKRATGLQPAAVLRNE
jgi:putative ABC transport system permease protein